MLHRCMQTNCDARSQTTPFTQVEALAGCVAIECWRWIVFMCPYIKIMGDNHAIQVGMYLNEGHIYWFYNSIR